MTETRIERCVYCGASHPSGTLPTAEDLAETLAEERARLAARIEAIDAEAAAAESRRFFLGIPWDAHTLERVREIGYSVPVALRAELLAHVPERLRAALAEGFADRDGAR